MYAVDGMDRVVPLVGVPQSSPGSPRPVVVCDEHELVLLYYVHGDEDVLAPEPVAMVRFEAHRAMMFGPPNDETFSGHPLAARGLTPYGAFVVEHSSWVRQLERMNAVHPDHRKARFERDRHFVFSFHDSTFECVAEGYAVEQAVGPIRDVMGRLALKDR